jgi:secondary thiamine-phosphate synthase enzyme
LAAQTEFRLDPNGPGLTEFTQIVRHWVAETALAGPSLLTLFVRHTSSSLLIQENADPDVQRDLAEFFHRLVPPSDHPTMSFLRHTSEGPDDMPAHIKAAMMPVSLQIPVFDAKLQLGTWQGIYMFEHRTRPRTRQITAHLG